MNLAVTYLIPAPEGSEVTIDARVVRAGKSLATIQVWRGVDTADLGCLRRTFRHSTPPIHVQVELKLSDGRTVATGIQ